MIDKARNNSSIVFSLEWEGWKLLFPGDAELRSWQEMNKQEQLQPVHFLKISHHASHNGTPVDELLEKIFPQTALDSRKRAAVASTFPNQYAGIPHRPTLARLEQRGVDTYVVFEELAQDHVDTHATTMGYIEFSFPAAGTEIGVRRQLLPAL